MKLSIRERTFSGSMVRGICEKTYGGEISRNAWQNWRTWAGVESSRRTYTFDELCVLYAIALIRSNEDDRYRQLKRTEVKAISENVDTHEMLADFVKLIDSNFVVGKDAPVILRTQGVKVSLRTLYRNVPGFCVNSVYSIDELKEWAVA